MKDKHGDENRASSEPEYQPVGSTVGELVFLQWPMNANTFIFTCCVCISPMKGTVQGVLHLSATHNPEKNKHLTKWIDRWITDTDEVKLQFSCFFLLQVFFFYFDLFSKSENLHTRTKWCQYKSAASNKGKV